MHLVAMQASDWRVPAWQFDLHAPPPLHPGGTSSGKQSRMAAYKENRLATGAYFSATVAGASLVAKSQGAGPLSEAEARLRPKSAGAGARPALSSASAAAMQKRNATANRPGWQRPASVGDGALPVGPLCIVPHTVS
jgi:hypothetical protein